MLFYFYARYLLYHNVHVALPYKAFKCKIQENIDSLLPLQHGGRSSDVIPGAREESVSLNPPGMANVGLHTTHNSEYWRQKIAFGKQMINL